MTTPSASEGSYLSCAFAQPSFSCSYLSLGLPAAAPAPAAGQQKLLIGLIPEMNIFEQKARFKLLGEYLSKQTGVAVQFTLLSRYGNILDSFATEKMDGALFPTSPLRSAPLKPPPRLASRPAL